ncbi:VanZ family protein [Clostridium sp. OM02-18AC]|uniref:VanZ family protein n=1 Tax=Clostridium sp. OM02-18AC TaxID=2292311 RepID=UPI0015FE429A|nr:VanZ family protein [Clostridium sp. OM02-18AC]
MNQSANKSPSFSRNAIKIMAMVPSIAIAFAIFYFSSQPAAESTVMSDGVTEMLLSIADKLHLLELQNIDVPAICELLSTPVRKCAHITEYTVFFLSLLFGLRTFGLHGKQLLNAALAITFFYACTDEIHQLFVPGRSGRFTDVLIDSIGAAAIRLLAPMFTGQTKNRAFPS